MRYYNIDGTYRDDPLDTEFGWCLGDIVINEDTQTYDQNEKIKSISQLKKQNSKIDNVTVFRTEINSKSIGDTNEFGESIDVMKDTDHKSQKIIKIEPNIPIETPINSVVCQQDVEGFIENPETHFIKEVKNIQIPSKDAMIELINPVNPETKALLKVISYSKYRGLKESDAKNELLTKINFKTTNSRRLLTEKNFVLSNKNHDSTFSNVNFLLNNEQVNIDDQLYEEIHDYHATKEDNMLSLMIELINTDLDSNFGNMSESNDSITELNTPVILETSDLGNSIHSSILSKEGHNSREDNKGNDTKKYLSIPNRQDILNSIGLSEDIDRSIQSFTKEKSTMHLQINNIKESLLEDLNKVDSLIIQATALKNDLREVTYLDNMIHLLNSHPEKVKNKNLPFRIFHEPNDREANCNFII